MVIESVNGIWRDVSFDRLERFYVGTKFSRFYGDVGVSSLFGEVFIAPSWYVMLGTVQIQVEMTGKVKIK